MSGSQRRALRPGALIAVVLAAALTVAGCGGTAPTTAASPPASTPQGPAVSSAPGAKPLLAGLVDMGSQLSYSLGTAFPTVDLSPVAAAPAAFGGIVVNETWAQLEPAAGQEDFQPLDASLAAVASYDAAHPADQLGVRLRIFGGFTAPAWAKSLAGGPLPDLTRPAGGTGSLGRWWTPAYRDAWSAFEHALAARYDGNPLVHEVAVTSCGTLTGEPFVEALGPKTIPPLEAAGWTPAAEQACLDGALGDYSGWHRTAVDFPFNTYRTVTGGKPVPDESVTDAVIADCVASAGRGGPRCLPANNALRPATELAASAPVYATIDAEAMQHPGLVATFQTFSPAPADDCGAVAAAISHHADSVELWPSTARISGFGSLPATQLTALDRSLLSHTEPSC